jgi:hypothetical protein
MEKVATLFQTGNAFLPDIENLVIRLGDSTSLLKFLQLPFLSNQNGGTSVHLLSAHGTYASHFLVQSLHSSSLKFPTSGGAMQEINGLSWWFVDTKEVKRLQPQW